MDEHFFDLITKSSLHVYIRSIVLLLTIMNPLGMLAIFMGMTSDFSPVERKIISIKSCIAIAVILIAVTWFGTDVLNFFGVKLPAFEIAGGILLFLGSLPMVSPKRIKENIPNDKDDVLNSDLAIVPLAFPIVSGPAAILQVMICLQKFGNTFQVKLVLSFAAMTSVLVLFLCFYFSDILTKFVSINGLRIIKIFVGIILLSIAVNIISHGIITIFHL
jgi:multiple antibiotic resistance protein